MSGSSVAPEVELYINGQIYTGFLSADITISIEDLSGTFTLNLTADFQNAGNYILPTDSARIAINGQTVISGYVDRVAPSFTKDSHTISVSGRDAACDLIDCCVVASTGQYRNLKIEEIISQICQPFNIRVSVDPAIDTGLPLTFFSIEQGMTAWEAIQKVCKIRRCLACSDSQGGILLTRAGTKAVQTGLAEGINIEKATAAYDYSMRHSEYFCKGQQASDNFTAIEQTTGAVGITLDAQVLRYRPTLIIAEGQATAQDCQDRSQWEQATRQAKAVRYTISTNNWVDPLTGNLWTINTLVTLNSPSLGVFDNLLIAKVNFTLDEDSGQMTTLELTPPNAYLTFNVDTSANAANAYLGT